MTLVRRSDALNRANVSTLAPDTERSSASSDQFCGKTRYSSPPVESEIDRLYRSLGEVTPESHPRTAKLLASGKRKVAQKVFEEAGEVAIEAVSHDSRGIVRESADLLYNLVALWYRAGIHPDDVWAEMRSRALKLGIAEKIPKDRDHGPRALRGAPKRAGGGNEPDA